MVEQVSFFAPGQTSEVAGTAELLGGKGANLAEMCRLGLPVPPGFTIATTVCSQVDRDGNLPADVLTAIDSCLARIEASIGRRFGDPGDPLLLAVRSGARKSMPGMMETVLDLGLNRQTLPGLAAVSGDPRFAWDAYRRLLTMYSDVVLEKAAGLDLKGRPGVREQLEHLLADAKKRRGVAGDNQLDAAALEELCGAYERRIEEACGRPVPSDPKEQLLGAIAAVFRSWHGKRAVEYRRIEKIPDSWGTAVNVQAMVFGNLGDGSATGVAFTRNPATGDNYLYGEWLPQAQGEDVVSGSRTPFGINSRSCTTYNQDLPTLEQRMPDAYAGLLEVKDTLERHFRDMQDLEFTIERGKLFMLQTRTGKRNGPAALRTAVQMVEEGLIDKKTAVRRVTPAQLDELLHPRIDAKAAAARPPFATGLPAGPGGAVGEICLTAEKAQELAAAGRKAVLVRKETSAEDIHGMHAAVAIVTAKGGMTSHAALVARGWGKTCVVGCEALEIDPESGQVWAGKLLLRQGDEITVDGTNGRLWLGSLPLVRAEFDEKGELGVFLQFCDELARLGVRTNADRPEDAALARRFGARGIGLCRTEHMFFGDARILAMRRMILAEHAEEREAAIALLEPYQTEDFRGILEAMAGYPVVIRLLDPPLHEFMPAGEEQIQELAAASNLPVAAVRQRIASLHESNPMLGHRGCRLGITHPEVTRMQVRAIGRAAQELRARGVEARPYVMVPLVGETRELEHQKKLALEVLEELGVDFPIPIGTMIEVPRACLTAATVAKVADFFSFGTNDLTQLTCGFSRDDIGTFLPRYLDEGIYPADPFASIDQEGVGALVELGTRKGREGKPGLDVGVCGEHGGDPASIHFFDRAGLDYVSCSPYRVPIARLAAAQSALAK
jgi:pyruvate,orthophosphate dikinase